MIRIWMTYIVKKHPPQKKETEGFLREDAKKPTVERSESLDVKQGIALTYGYTNHEEIPKSVNVN